MKDKNWEEGFTMEEYEEAYKKIAENAEKEAMEMRKDEMVEHPSHYNIGGYEAIDIIEALELNFNLGNAFKYLFRAGHKDDKIQDLNKCLWYVNREIKRLDSLK